jgi:uncharacterized protein (DUF58 family)
MTPGWWAALLVVALAALGWGIHSVLLALLGTLGALSVLTIWVWQRQCLTNVTYRRTLSHRRAEFAEEVVLTAEVVNDKLLPLTWLHVEDRVPEPLPIRGGTVDDGASRRGRVLHLLFPILPFGRVRRRLTIVCDQRGAYTFGPAYLESGDPVGYSRRTARLGDLDHLLVYPKRFRLEPLGVASRMILGDQRSSAMIVGDPSRVAGVREYRSGDPLRHVDWRATARSPSLLVRVYEPTTSLLAAVFVDLGVPRTRGPVSSADRTEFIVAVAASVVADLAGREVGVGLYSGGTVNGFPLAYAPSTSPSALPDMLELLAQVSPFATKTLGEVIASVGGRFGSGVSVVVIAAHFSETTVAAMAHLRRRMPVTSVWVGNDTGSPPPAGAVDACEEVGYVGDWKQRTALAVAV